MDATVPLYNSKLCISGSCPVSVLTTAVLGLRGLPGWFVAKNNQCRWATAGHGPGHCLRRPEAAARGQPGLRPRFRNRRPRQRPGAMMVWGHARPGHRPGHIFMKWPSQCTWTFFVLIAYYRTYSDSVPPDFFSNSRPRTQYVLSQVLNLVLEY